MQSGNGKSVGPPSSSGDPADAGVAGASARREYEKRRANREDRIRAAHPWTAGVRLALGTAPQHERAWATGATGEELVADSLASRCGDRVSFLHDRRIPGSRANIDHIAIAPSGVWVIDPKNYKGKVRIEKPFGAKAKLRVDGRDRTTLIDGLDRQVELARAAVTEIDPSVPVQGALCFIDADLPMFRTLTFRGYPLLWRKGMAKRLNAAGTVTPEQINWLAQELAKRFKPA